MQQSDNTEEMSELYGPLAAFSEYKRGEKVAYLDENRAARQGTILWICAPTAEQGIQYVIEPSHRTGFPDFVNASDISNVQ